MSTKPTVATGVSSPQSTSKATHHPIPFLNKASPQQSSTSALSNVASYGQSSANYIGGTTIISANTQKTGDNSSNIRHTVSSKTNNNIMNGLGSPTTIGATDVVTKN